MPISVKRAYALIWVRGHVVAVKVNFRQGVFPNGSLLFDRAGPHQPNNEAVQRGSFRAELQMLDVMLDGSAAEPESRCDFPTGSPQNQESGNIPLARAEVKRSAIRPDPKRTTKPLAVDGNARGASELTQVSLHWHSESPGLPLGEDHSTDRAA